VKVLAAVLILSSGGWLWLPGVAQASACKAGETRFRNGIFWTCVCTTSGGQTSCGWTVD